LPLFLRAWFNGRNRWWPMYMIFRYFSKIYLLGHENSACMHYIPYLTVLKDYKEQANYWLLWTTMIAGQSVPICTHPTHVHLWCSTTVEVPQLMASSTHQCRF
jgi:hypothetical protein